MARACDRSQARPGTRTSEFLMSPSDRGGPGTRASDEVPAELRSYASGFLQTQRDTVQFLWRDAENSFAVRIDRRHRAGPGRDAALLSWAQPQPGGVTSTRDRHPHAVGSRPDQRTDRRTARHQRAYRLHSGRAAAAKARADRAWRTGRTRGRRGPAPAADPGRGNRADLDPAGQGGKARSATARSRAARASAHGRPASQPGSRIRSAPSL